ncbi:hypothetical protein FQA39_LY17672 [Lamprigera yunnana]|nr:hypothetical protein FQA39_LY17672 [Lamprigera yunnana]
MRLDSSFPSRYKGLPRGQFLASQYIGNGSLIDNLSSNNTLSAEKATQPIHAVEYYTSAEIAESTCGAETYILSEAEIIIEADANVPLNEEIPTLTVLEENHNELILCSEVAENPIFEDNNKISSHSGYRPLTPNDPDWVAANSDESNIDQEPSDSSAEESVSSVNQKFKKKKYNINKD